MERAMVEVNTVVAEFTFCNLSFRHDISEITTLSEMKGFVLQNWPYLPASMQLSYYVEGIFHILRSNFDLKSLIVYYQSKRIPLVNFLVQFDTSSTSTSSSRVCSSSSSSCVSNQVIDLSLVEDLTDDASQYKMEPRKVDAWANILTGPGQIFDGGIEEVRDTIMKYQVHSGYKLKPVKSDRSRYTVECKFSKSRNCHWRFHASKVTKNSDVFSCKTFFGEHSCGLACSDPSKLRMRKAFVKNVITDELTVSDTKKTAVDVMDLFRREFGVELSYSQAYHGLDFGRRCLWGGDVKSYSDFVWYSKAVKQYNPGSVIDFEFDPDTRQFKRFFLSFQACITGFNKYCRPMVIIDATFLTGKYKGGLMVACSKTGNQEIYPLAFGIVSGEDGENWRWFLENLKGIIDDDRPLTIISDRGTGLLQYVPTVFPLACHSYCYYHMKGNLPVPKGKSRELAVKLFQQCYNACTREKFLLAATSLHNLKLTSVIDWMTKIPLKNWATHQFPGKRYGENTSNVAESFNSWIRHQKRLPAIELIDCIRAKVMEQMFQRKVISSQWKTKLTPVMNGRLANRINDCRLYKVRASSEKVFEVVTNKGKHLVDLDAQTCSCRWWQTHSFPCTHAVKAMLQIGEDEVYKHIEPFYTTDYYRGLYSLPVYPIPDSEKPPEISETDYVLPPAGRALVGRPNTNRYRSYHEKVRKKRKCGRCGFLTFHNRQTCRKPALAPCVPTFRKRAQISNFLRAMFE